MKNRVFPLLLFSALSSFCTGQNAGFSIPDTVCENVPVTITNVQPPSAASYKWSFCTGNASYEPDGVNLGNPNLVLNAPRFITLVQDGTEYYTFATSTGNSSVLRCYYGTSLTQNPLANTDLGNFGALTNLVTGIQVKNDNGDWFGFVANGNKLVRLVFGASLKGTPVPQIITLSDVTSASGLIVTKEGSNWIGFCTDIDANNIIRLDFGSTLANNPLETNLGNIGELNRPASLFIADENNKWYAFISNIGNSTLTRVDFGSSLLNPAPSGSNLLNVGGLKLNAGITLIKDCGGYNGFVVNCVIESDLCIVHLVFPKGLGGVVQGYHIQNNGVLNKPYGISEVIRKGDTIYGFVANYGSSSITRMFFPSCSDGQPISTLRDPPPFSYPDSGNYNIMLTVNENSPEQSSICHNIVVIPKPELSLGADRTICQGKTTLLDAGTGIKQYSWSTGATTRTITVDTSGTYWVGVTNSGNCIAYDTIKVTVNEHTTSSIDTTICQGLKYWAQHAFQTNAGVYHDTLQSVNGCDSILTTTLQLKNCQLIMWFPNAFTPNGDGLNDVFRPVGREINKYKLQIYNRWGELIFESSDISQGWDGRINGKEAGPDVYTFDAVFDTWQYPGVTHRETGTFTLAK